MHFKTNPLIFSYTPCFIPCELQCRNNHVLIIIYLSCSAFTFSTPAFNSVILKKMTIKMCQITTSPKNFVSLFSKTKGTCPIKSRESQLLLTIILNLSTWDTHLFPILHQKPVPRINLSCLIQKGFFIFCEIQSPLKSDQN